MNTATDWTEDWPKPVKDLYESCAICGTVSSIPFSPELGSPMIQSDGDVLSFEMHKWEWTTKAKHRVKGPVCFDCFGKLEDNVEVM